MRHLFEEPLDLLIGSGPDSILSLFHLFAVLIGVFTQTEKHSSAFKHFSLLTLFIKIDLINAFISMVH